MSEEEQRIKFYEVCKVASCAGFSAFLLIFVFKFIKEDAALDSQEFDVKNLTPSDFTLELEIGLAMWNNFYEKHYETEGKLKKNKDGMTYSPALYMKEVLGQRVEDILNNCLNQYKDELEKEKDNNREILHLNGPEEKNKIEVVDIHLAYNNEEMIKLLKDRGAALIAADWPAQRVVEKDINELLKVDAKLKQFTTPVSAFITFNSEKGVHSGLKLAKKFSENREIKIFG